MKVSTQNILLLCSDENVSKSIQEVLSSIDSKIVVRSNSIDSVNYVLGSTWDLLVIHAVGDHSFALNACRQVRTDKPLNQIVIISENTDSEFIATCLDQGADDYISIPWYADELLARVTVAIRRHQKVQQLLITPDGVEGIASFTTENPDEVSTQADASDCLNCGDIQLCQVKREVSVRDSQLRLTRTEYSLLAYLMERISRPCSSVELLNDVLGYENENYLPSLHSHVSRLRRKLGESKTTTIETIWCYGYRLLVR